jgi:hypothetical protein
VSRPARVLARLTLALAALVVVPLHAQSPVTVGIVGWPLDPADSLHALVSDVEVCLAARIAQAAPDVTVLSQRAVRDALFPLLEPATQPHDERAFASLLAREDARARLHARGVRFLVAFAGGTRKEAWEGGILCGASMGGGGCLGFAWQSESTSLDAALWSIDGDAPVSRQAAKTEGTSVMPAFVLPIPIMARTRSEACEELGTRLANAIRGSAAKRRD